MSKSVLEHDVTQVAGPREYGHDGQKHLEAVEVVAVGLDAKPKKEIIQYR